MSRLLWAQDTFYVGTLKGVAGSISRLSSTPRAKWVLPSCTTGTLLLL